MFFNNFNVHIEAPRETNVHEFQRDGLAFSVSHHAPPLRQSQLLILATMRGQDGLMCTMTRESSSFFPFVIGLIKKAGAI